MTIPPTRSLDELPEPTDTQLMARMQTGDRSALGSLVDRHKDGLVNYLTRITGHRDRGEELAQESFLRLFQAAPKYREQGRLLPFLYRIATNLVRTEERREKRYRLFSIANPHGPAGEPHAHAAGAARLLQQEAQREVQRALSELPLHFRAPVVLHGVEGWTYQAIANLLGCREGTVKSRIHRGHQRLRVRLQGYWKGEGR